MVVGLGRNCSNLIAKADVRGEAVGDLDVVLKVGAEDGLANAAYREVARQNALEGFWLIRKECRERTELECSGGACFGELVAVDALDGEAELHGLDSLGQKGTVAGLRGRVPVAMNGETVEAAGKRRQAWDGNTRSETARLGSVARVTGGWIDLGRVALIGLDPVDSNAGSIEERSTKDVTLVQRTDIAIDSIEKELVIEFVGLAGIASVIQVRRVHAVFLRELHRLLGGGKVFGADVGADEAEFAGIAGRCQRAISQRIERLD